jgi:hypothetical protein
MAVTDLLFGRSLASDEEGEHRVGVFAGIPMLGLDALGSAAYGPEAALTLLLPLGAASSAYIGPISTLIIILLMVVYFSYRQTILAYPHGGGSYTVARENLGTIAGLLAAAALMLDYVLVVAVGISAGVGALISAAPALEPFTLPLCLAILAIITVVNLRGVRESGLVFALPTYMFIVSLLTVLVIGTIKAVLAGGWPEAVTPPPALPSAATAATWWLLMRSFASGCTAMTGVEAVSNGVSAFREPAVGYARRTLTAIIGLLAIMLAGIAYLCSAYHISATEPGQAGYDSILSQLTAAVVGRGWFYYITIGSVLAVLAPVSQHGFRGFSPAMPRNRPGRLLAEQLCPPRPTAGVFARHPRFGRSVRWTADRLRRHHGQPDSAFRHRRLPRLHSFPGGHGGSLAKDWRPARTSLDGHQCGGGGVHGGNAGGSAGFQIHGWRLGHDAADSSAPGPVCGRTDALPGRRLRGGQRGTAGCV